MRTRRPPTRSRPPGPVQSPPEVGARLTAESWPGLASEAVAQSAPVRPDDSRPHAPAPGFPSRPSETRDTGSADDPQRPGSSRPGVWGEPSAAPPLAAGAWIPLGQSDHDVAPPLRQPTIAEELPSPPRRPATDAPLPPATAPQPGPGRHTRGLYSGMQGRMAGSAIRLRPRWIAVAAAAILLVVIVVLATHAGLSSGVAGGNLPRPTPTSGVRTSGAPSQRSSVPASAGPSAGVSTAPTATPIPSATSSAQTYGSGGSGWRIASVRCCYVQGDGNTRVVYYLTGSSGASPTATVTFPTATTMVLSFTGATLAESTPAASGGVIMEMNPASGSQAEFKFELTHAATIKDWGYLPRGDATTPSPLMYFDLG